MTDADAHKTIMEAIELSLQDSGYAASPRLSRAAHAAASASLAALRVAALTEGAGSDPRETDGSTPENPRLDGTYGWPKP